MVGYNILVIVWGALVRATGSGAGCGNHWPLCNGQVIPISPSVHTVIEFTHRMMTGGASVLVLTLVLWTFAATRPRSAARVSAVLAGALLLNEAFLGALLVKLGYVTGNQSVGRVVLLSVHLTNTLLLLAGLSVTALLLSTGLGRGAALGPWRTWLRPPRLTALAGLAATLLVGVSGSLAALGDTLFPAASLREAVAADLAASSPALIRFRWVHPVSALVAAGMLVWLLRWVWRRPNWSGRGARVIVVLLGLQFALGVADVLLLAPVWLQLLHLAGADLYWVALVSLSARAMIAGAPDAAEASGGIVSTKGLRRRAENPALL